MVVMDGEGERRGGSVSKLQEVQVQMQASASVSECD